MSYVRLNSRPTDPTSDALRQRLAQEFRAPHDGAPYIFAEGPRPDVVSRLFVAWDAWAGIDERQRSEIILDAYEEVNGIEKALVVSIAMGLTEAEARAMRLLAAS